MRGDPSSGDRISSTELPLSHTLSGQEALSSRNRTEWLDRVMVRDLFRENTLSSQLTVLLFKSEPGRGVHGVTSETQQQSDQRTTLGIQTHQRCSKGRIKF